MIVFNFDVYIPDINQYSIMTPDLIVREFLVG